jgi:hypothetical protein
MMTDLLGTLPHKHETLSVRDDLGGIESLFKIVDEELLVAAKRFFLRTSEYFTSPDTFLLDRRQAAGKDGFSNESN